MIRNERLNFKILFFLIKKILKKKKEKRKVLKKKERMANYATMASSSLLESMTLPGSLSVVSQLETEKKILKVEKQVALEKDILNGITESVEFRKQATSFPFMRDVDANKKYIANCDITSPEVLRLLVGGLSLLFPQDCPTDVEFHIDVNTSWSSTDSSRRRMIRSLILGFGTQVCTLNFVKISFYFTEGGYIFGGDSFMILFFKGYLKTRPQFARFQTLDLSFDKYSSNRFCSQLRKFVKVTKLDELVLSYDRKDFDNPDHRRLLIDLFEVGTAETSPFVYLREITLSGLHFSSTALLSFAKFLVSHEILSLTLADCTSAPSQIGQKPESKPVYWKYLFSGGVLGCKTLRHLNLIRMKPSSCGSTQQNIEASDLSNELCLLFKNNTHVEEFSLAGLEIPFKMEQWERLFKALQKSKRLKEPINLYQCKTPYPSSFVDFPYLYVCKD